MYTITELLPFVPPDLGPYGYIDNGSVISCQSIDSNFARKNRLTHAGFTAFSGLFEVQVKTSCYHQSFCVKRAVPVGAKVKIPHKRSVVPGWGSVVGLVIG